MTILKHTDPRLTQPCKPVELNPDTLSFLNEMVGFFETDLKWGKPLGLAAPQVGRNIRAFIALGKVFINPEILWMPQGGKIPCKEGCYSLEENKYDYPVTRAYAVKLKWQDWKGAWHEQRFNDLSAQVIQHEMDHLEGKLCVSEL